MSGNRETRSRNYNYDLLAPHDLRMFFIVCYTIMKFKKFIGEKDKLTEIMRKLKRLDDITETQVKQFETNLKNFDMMKLNASGTMLSINDLAFIDKDITYSDNDVKDHGIVVDDFSKRKSIGVYKLITDLGIDLIESRKVKKTKDFYKYIDEKYQEMNLPAKEKQLYEDLAFNQHLWAIKNKWCIYYLDIVNFNTDFNNLVSKIDNENNKRTVDQMLLSDNVTQLLLSSMFIHDEDLKNDDGHISKNKIKDRRLEYLQKIIEIKLKELDGKEFIVSLVNKKDDNTCIIQACTNDPLSVPAVLKYLNEQIKPIFTNIQITGEQIKYPKINFKEDIQLPINKEILYYYNKGNLKEFFKEGYTFPTNFDNVYQSS